MYKMLRSTYTGTGYPMYVIENLKSFEPVFDAVVTKVDESRRAVSRLGTPTERKGDRELVEKTFTKISGKLFKPKDRHNFREVADDLVGILQRRCREAHYGAHSFKADKDIWPKTAELAKAVCARKGGLFGMYSRDDQKHQHVLGVAHALAQTVFK